VAILDTLLVTPEIVDEPSGYLETLIDRIQRLIIDMGVCDPNGERYDEYPDEDDDPELDAMCVELVIDLYRRGGVEHVTSVSMGDYSFTVPVFHDKAQAVIASRRAPAWA